jgi:transposase
MSNRFTEQFKADAVGLVVQGRSISDVSKSLGIGLSTLDKWVRSAKNKSAPPVPALTVDKKRLRDLEKENAHLWEVNDILKIGKLQSSAFGERWAA